MHYIFISHPKFFIVKQCICTVRFSSPPKPRATTQQQNKPQHYQLNVASQMCLCLSYVRHTLTPVTLAMLGRCASVIY